MTLVYGIPMRRAAARLVDSLPVAASKFLVKSAAFAPPRFKTPLFERICSRVAKNIVNYKECLGTNMGISSRLRCEVPVRKFHYLFGRPENNLSERATYDLIRRLSFDCRSFLDVGANEGLFTFGVYEFRGREIEIHFFEPDEYLFRRLTKNLKLNCIHAHGNNIAVARESGQAIFYQNLDDDASGSLTNYFSRTHRTKPNLTETVSLSDYFTSHDIDGAIVKIDVEGAGSEVWSGASDVMSKIKYLVIEILEPEVKSGLPSRIISQTGWQAYYIKDFDLIHSAGGGFTYVPPFWNWLFCKLSPSALAERLVGTKFRITA